MDSLWNLVDIHIPMWMNSSHFCDVLTSTLAQEQHFGFWPKACKTELSSQPQQYFVLVEKIKNSTLMCKINMVNMFCCIRTNFKWLNYSKHAFRHVLHSLFKVFFFVVVVLDSRR